jgi:hypothetical protein
MARDWSMRRVLGFLVIASATPGYADSHALPRCAARLAITVQVADPSGHPVPGAELWYVDTLGGVVSPSDARLVGSTDDKGRLVADICYISELFYCARTPSGVASLRFMVLKDGFGVLRLERSAPAGLVVKDGWTIDRQPCEWETPPRKRLPLGRGYRVPLSGTLRPVQ